jgi:hypothetical protein
VCSHSKDGEPVVKFTLVAEEHNKGRNGNLDPVTKKRDKLRTAFKLQLQVLSNNQVSARYKLAVEPTVEGSHYKTPQETEDGALVKNADEVVFEGYWTDIGPDTNAFEVPNLQMDQGAAVLMSQWDEGVDSVAMRQDCEKPQQHPEEVEAAAKHRFRQLLEEACHSEWTPATWFPEGLPPGVSELLPQGLPE